MLVAASYYDGNGSGGPLWITVSIVAVIGAGLVWRWMRGRKQRRQGAPGADDSRGEAG